MYRILIISISAALLFITQGLLAQNSISGKISTRDHEVLTGANIIIKNTTIGTASDKEGNYRIEGLKNGTHEVRVSFFGYETVEKEVVLSGQDLILDFEMAETSIDLHAVVVTGTRTEKTIKNTPVLTQTIGIRELINKDVTDITQALEMAVPGIEFSSTAAGKSVTLQGIDPQYLLFLVDGERLAGETFGDIDYSRINMADVERIEVVKGAGSTLYGSNALGGVVNIITKTPSRKLNLQASSRLSKYNARNHQASIGSKLGKFSTQTSVSFDATDGYDLSESNNYRTQEKEDALVVSEHLKYSPSPALLVEGNLSFMNKNRDNTSEELDDRRNRDLTCGTKAAWFFNSRDNVTLSWNSDHYELLNKASGGELISDYDNLFRSARALGNFSLADWNLLTLGTEYITENLTAPRNNISDKKNADYIVFAQEDLQVGENANILGGFRAHNNSQYGWHFSPQFSAMVSLSHLTFRGNYAMGYKTPSMKEKYMSFQIPAPGPPMFLVGFEGLKPETSEYLAFSAEYTKNRMTLSLSLYQNNISDMITESMEGTVKPGGVIEYTYRNYDHIRLKGVDLLLKTNVMKRLLISGTATFSRKYDQLQNKEFDNVRNFTGKFNADYHLNSGSYILNLNLQGNYYGAKTISLMDDITHKTELVKLERFSLWKLTAMHTFHSGFSLKTGIDNIFGYTDPSGGYNNGTPGRTFFVGLGINL